MEAYQKSFAMLCPCTVELRYAAGIATAKQIKLYQANVLFTSEHIRIHKFSNNDQQSVKSLCSMSEQEKYVAILIDVDRPGSTSVGRTSWDPPNGTPEY